jgi:hypothetical protein
VAQTSYKIEPHEHLLVVSNEMQKFKLPFCCASLFSHMQHFVVAEGLDEEFVEVVVECLMILKEHFPHKVT